ncbi:hypothetical protein [Salinibacterium sp.]|uniref:hypothetical protein n=1 Tax=Salinibacterium sp. TaxID=1915057 RepID=UPI00286A6721|nr:hypothetical protein [Salinibacterium sp.]
MDWPFRRHPTVDSSSAPAVSGTTVAVHNTRRQGWSRLLQGNRVIWIIAAVAILSMVAGLALGQFITSPGDAASNASAPKPGLITVPVEKRVLANDVTIRGDATYADAVDVKIETGGIGGPAVVTGQVPAIGATFTPLSIALEIAGRPVIVLPGDLPVYRTLRVGVSGPDVIQLKQALVAVGINPGDAASSLFDADTASAITALYAAVGYPTPESETSAADSVRSASDGVASAANALAAAERELAGAQSGPTAVEQVEQDNLVRSAQRALATAQQATPSKPDVIADAQDALTLAEARRAAVFAPKNTGAQRAAVDAAAAQLGSARELLGDARTGTLTFLPSSEVLYLAGLPRRVDEITVQRGSTVTGSVMKVSGATLVINASAAKADATLIEKGAKASFVLPDGTEKVATVTLVGPAGAAKDAPGTTTPGGTNSSKTDAGRYDIQLIPDALTPEELAQLQGTNVRVSIPVSSTEGEVLAVPIAALTAGAGGESRVEVSTGKGNETRLVEVTTGLAADGFVEVSSTAGELGVDDLVVVGR